MYENGQLGSNVSEERFRAVNKLKQKEKRPAVRGRLEERVTKKRGHKNLYSDKLARISYWRHFKRSLGACSSKCLI